MEIQLKDLQVGDEILVPSASKFRYYRVLRPIKERINKKTNTPLGTYKAVRVSANIEEIKHSRTYSSRVHNWIEKRYHCTPENHNIELYANLNYKSLWLINRK